jgi:hypothetical protein
MTRIQPRQAKIYNSIYRYGVSEEHVVAGAKARVFAAALWQ